MGVTGLWTVVQPCARPIKIETLNKKRLAVDASIWIYQFLKAVRDKEGNALRNSHIVGFFRRICKLLFVGIKPVFVFDGGAPTLKRQTISNRKSRREGRREDAVRTAGKLLAMQMQRAAEEEENKRKEVARHPREEPEEEIPENVVYTDELLQTPQERAQNRRFKKKDQYHLPDLGVSLAEMGQPNDPRIMSLEELEAYARQFDTGEDINVYDFSKIDFDSPFFMSLPASDRYNILNAARLRSRLRMGYSKDQLDTMFPDRMAFSRFQIERVAERNDLTQRLMNLNGMSDDKFSANASRVAGEHGREYVLVKNDGAEGGWALGVVTNKDEGKVDKPIDVDRDPLPEPDDEDWEDDEFEDVPIEGLNRLPKSKPGLTIRDREGQDFISKEVAKRRQNLYRSGKAGPSRPRGPRNTATIQDPNSLFIADEDDEKWEQVPVEGNDDVFEAQGLEKIDDEEEQLQRAIALSLQQGEEESNNESEQDIYREVFQQERAKDSNLFATAKGSGMGIARLANQRSTKAAPAGPFNGSDSEDDMDLQAALAESRKSKRFTGARRPPKISPPMPSPSPKSISMSTNAPGFDGPLPFEKLNLGNSLLGKKKMDKLEENNAGGFEKYMGSEKKKTAEPLPPWFDATRNIGEEMTVLREDKKRDWEKARKEEEQFQFQEPPRLRKHGAPDVIDVDAPSQEKHKESLVVDSDNEADKTMEDAITQEIPLREGDLAIKLHSEPPQPLSENQKSPPEQDKTLVEKAPFIEELDDDVDWSESEPEDERRARVGTVPDSREAPQQLSKSSSPEFEDVPIQTEMPTREKALSPEFEDVPLQTNHSPRRPRREMSPNVLQGPADLEIPVVPHDSLTYHTVPLDLSEDDSDQYSDPEDAELFASLAKEAEEHARFAQELNKTTASSVNFDEELKQLRAQQKKDRRDADEVTQTMISECQHLLTLFGLPYVTAPMEAEAQCAELVTLGLVDGIVTDDSDAFLFGGTRVYKNMFNAAKYVECYLSSDLTSEFALTREKLIDIAQLLGSDYTPGIPGIGPVTALEILSEFGSLKDFRAWWSGVQNGTVSKEADKSSAFRRRFRRTQITKLFLPTGFPDSRVKEAYLLPEVDDSPEAFQWGVPDLDALRTFLRTQIGWSWERTDEVLVPVIKDMNRREKEGTQANITRFFEGSVGAGAFAPRVRGEAVAGPNGKKKGKEAAGKRLGVALTRLAERERGSRGEGEHGMDNGEGGAVDVVAETTEATSTHDGNKRRRVRGNNVAATTAEDQDGDEDDAYVEPKKKKARKTRNKD
ncbi:PIN domain-like protein [Massarina eburnea CBS 473.64]|uniref:PIN domain-like protein n=1 Tax=Massarina eburnea CBS 473.64 TaxID=1395130 RepID=A0A6A6S7N1_9PLEO|nr:PIN domain-like protein [Massarina eburnea CBS 473.64]